MVMGPSLWTTLFTLAMPLRMMVTPIMPTAKMPMAPSRILNQ